MLPEIQFGGIFRLTASPMHGRDAKRLKQFGKTDETVENYGYGVLNQKGILQDTATFTYNDRIMLVKNDPDQPDLDALETALQASHANKTKVEQDFFSKAEQEKRIETLELCYTVLQQPQTPIFAPNEIQENMHKPFSECALNPNRPGKYLGLDDQGMANRLVIRRLKITNPETRCSVDMLM